MKTPMAKVGLMHIKRHNKEHMLNDIHTARVMSYEKAERIAEANNKDDPEWEYIVERVVYNEHYPTAIIRVHDEDGHRLGWL